MSATLTVADVLRVARELYAQAPSHVLEGPVPYGTFCAITAVGQAYGGLNPYALNALRNAAGVDSLSAWNAENSTETVLAAFDAAIAQADNLDPSSPVAETMRRDIGGTT